MAAEGGPLELSVINPAGIFGPVLGPDFSSSIELVKRLLNGMPGCPRIYFGVVDVRDVADLHVRAMTHPRAAGERFIAASGSLLSMLDIAASVPCEPSELRPPASANSQIFAAAGEKLCDRGISCQFDGSVERDRRVRGATEP